MCKRGDVVEVMVQVPPDLVADGPRRRHAPIDRCIAPLVAALQDGEVLTRGSCCGHGESAGYIELLDGRCLVVLGEREGKAYIADSHPGIVDAAIAVLRGGTAE